MAVIPNIEVTATDLQDPSLSVLNDLHRRIITEINRLNGVHGTIALNNDVDLQGNFQIVNNNQADEVIPPNYVLATNDLGKLKVFTSAVPVAVGLNSQATKRQFNSRFLFTGKAGGTIKPTSGLINGQPSLTFTQGQGGNLFFDGTNWWVT